MNETRSNSRTKPKRGALRGEMNSLKDSEKTKDEMKYEIINYYSHQYIQFCIEWLTHKECIAHWMEAVYRIDFHYRLHAVKTHQNTELHNFWKDLFDITKHHKYRPSKG